MIPKRPAEMFRALWNWRRKESDLDDEIAFHLSEEADERRANGLAVLLGDGGLPARHHQRIR